MLSKMLQSAASEGRSSLFEYEVYEILRSYGLPVPEFQVFPSGDTGEDLSVPGDRIVLKVMQSDLTHKSDQGGVLISDRDDWENNLQTLRLNFPAARALLAVEFVAHQADALGGELMLGIRHTDGFGYVLSFGPGGTDAEHLHEVLPGAHCIAALETDADQNFWNAFFTESVITPYLLGQVRGKKKLLDLDACTIWAEGMQRLVAEAREAGYTIEECEFNPLAASGGKLVALDAVFRFSPLTRSQPRTGIQNFSDRQEKIDHLLHPSSVAVIGVSGTSQNPGRIVVQNLLHDGFAADSIYIVKPGAQTIEDCRCFPSISALPVKVDVLVLSVDAAQVPTILHELNAGDKAHSVILISGGLAEKAGGESLEQQVVAEINQGKFVLNGGNCLGVRSLPEHFHTFFVPHHKLPMPQSGRTNVAILSQSGAFSIVRMNRFAWMNPRYNISTGNQTDLRAVDYLEALAEETEVDVFGLYLEGLKTGDGTRLRHHIEKMTKAGKRVIVYKAGRTASGRTAVQGHTASIAGDYPTTAQILKRAGAYVAETFEQFEDLLMLSSFYPHLDLSPRQIFAVSNAGFECAALGDHLRGIELLDIQAKPEIKARLEAVLTTHRLSSIVGAKNPLDVTPMAGDAPLIDLLKFALETPEIGVLLLSIVPFAPTLQSLPASDKWVEDLSAPGALSSVLSATTMTKPVLICIDAGAQYDPYALAFFQAGYPVMRSIDRAAQALSTFFRLR